MQKRAVDATYALGDDRLFSEVAILCTYGFGISDGEYDAYSNGEMIS
jgi:hypothetical protein